jgi:hypothetical protein
MDSHPVVSLKRKIELNAMHLANMHSYRKAKLMTYVACEKCNCDVDKLDQDTIDRIDAYIDAQPVHDASAFPLPIETLSWIPVNIILRAIKTLRDGDIEETQELVKSATNLLHTNWQISNDFFEHKSRRILYRSFMLIDTNHMDTSHEYTFASYIEYVANGSIGTFHWLYDNDYIRDEDINNPDLFQYMDVSNVIFEKFNVSGWDKKNWNDLASIIAYSGFDTEQLTKINDKFGEHLKKYKKCAIEAAKSGNLEQLKFFIDHGYPVDYTALLISTYLSYHFDSCKDVIDWLATQGRVMTKRIVDVVYRHKLLNDVGFGILFERFGDIRLSTFLEMIKNNDAIICKYLQSKKFAKYLAILATRIDTDTKAKISQCIRELIAEAIQKGQFMRCPCCYVIKSGSAMLSDDFVPRESLCDTHRV